MEWDEDGLDDELTLPLLPPDDRLWRHPSEVAGVPATSVRGRSGASRPGTGQRVVTIAVLTGCVSMLLTVGAVLAIRPFRSAGIDPAPAPAQPDESALDDVADLTARIRPAIAQIVARDATGERRWGSGVLFRSDGLVLTAHHIVSGADVVRVILDDGRDLVARFVGSDAETDMALLDLDGEDFPTVPLGTGRSTKVGQRAITIGAPSGTASERPLVRVSMVSGVGQEAGVEGRHFVDMIRTEAAVAAGCSGGAVVDGRGNVIGIAVSNVTMEDGAIGFATPIDVARSVVTQLMDTGKVTRGWLGIEGETGEKGVLVRTVKEGSPAERAGMSAGDVITGVDGADIDSMPGLVVRLREERPGDRVTLRLERQGSTVDVTVTLVEKPVTA